MLSLLLVVLTAAPEEYLSQGKDLLARIEDRKAAETFEAGLSQHPPPALEAQLAVYLGLARYNIFDGNGARQAFRRALQADSTVEPPDNPRAASLFGEEKAAFHAASERPARNRLKLYAVGGSGVAIIGVGLIFGYSATQARTAAIQAKSADGARGLMDVGNRRALTSTILIATGAAVAATGVGLAFWPGQNGGGFFLVQGRW